MLSIIAGFNTLRRVIKIINRILLIFHYTQITVGYQRYRYNEHRQNLVRGHHSEQSGKVNELIQGFRSE